MRLEKLSSVLLYLGLIIFCIFTWLLKVRNLDLQIAWGGFSPIAYVYKTYHTANFARDFPGGVEQLGKSAVIHIYNLAFHYLGITPEALLPAIVAIEYGLFAWAIYALSRTLIPKAPPVVAVMTVIWAIASYARNIDLGRWGQLFAGQYYNVADALRIFAIIQVFKGRMIPGALLLAGGCISHPIMGLFGGILILALLQVKPGQASRKSVLAGGLLFLAITSAWFFSTIDPVSMAGEGIPHRNWFDLTKLNSLHWYPFDYGLFTVEHRERFVPFLSFMLLFIFYASRRNLLASMDRGIAAGIVTLMILSVVGVAISILTPSPELIKLALHRADTLVVIVGLPYIVNGLWNEFESPHYWRRVLAIIILVSPFISHPGFPVLLSLVIVAPACLSLYRKKERTVGNYLVGILSLLIALLALFYLATGLLGPLSSDAYTLGMSLARVFSVYDFVCLLPLLAVGKWSKKFLVCGTVIVVFTFFAIFWVRGDRMSSGEMLMARDYKEVQLWAKSSTAKDVLFMTDPTIYYGWRDYSQRSSFGNLREWLLSSWQYNSDLRAYQEGMRRFNEFSIKLDDYLHEKPPIVGFGKLNGKIKEKYYSANDEWRMNLARKYGIDYFVMIKKEMTEPSMQQVVYENEHFLVLEAKLKPGTSKKWHEIITLDSDIVNSKANENLGWSTFSEGRPVTWPWGLTADNSTGTKELYLNQPDKHDYWLYTGQGAITNPPNSPLDSKWHISKKGKCRLKVFLRGKGFTDIYIWWYDEKGRDRKNHIHSHHLSSEYEQLVKIFELPEEAKTFRISFLLRSNNAEPSTLFIKKLIVEGEEQ